MTDSPTLMPASSRYAGRPMDDASRRSIELAAGEHGDATIGDGARIAVADYFYHEGEYWRAVIPLDGVAEVYGQVFNFSKPKMRQGGKGPEIVFDKHGLPKRTMRLLNHIQCRFKMKPGECIRLYPPGGPTSGAPAHEIDDFIYSLEVCGPLGATFNLRDGLAGSFVSAHRFLSTREMVFERIVVESQYVIESPPLPLDDDQRRKLLIESLRRSDRAGVTEPYYLYRCCGTNNCTSSPFQILDHVVRYSPMQWLGSAFYRLPLNPRFYLRVRGMDSDPNCRRFVRDEFQAYIEDDQTQRRKREYVRDKAEQTRAARRERHR